MELLALHHFQNQTINFLDTIKDFLPTLLGFGALAFSIYQLRTHINENRKEKRREEINRKLNEFYAPFILLRQKSDMLYKKFESSHRKNDPNFSTLKSLLAGHEFDGNDKALLNEIIEIGKLSEKLLLEKAGLIDDKSLRKQLIPRVSTHYLVLRLAHQGSLKGEEDLYADLTFPIELNKKLEEVRNQLEDELEKLIN